MHRMAISPHCAPHTIFTCHRGEHGRGHAPSGRFWGGPTDEMDDDNFGGGGFGVRRPLRFIAHKLNLDDRQIAELARILAELKTERAQAEVDNRRTISAFADAVAGNVFDAAKAGEGGLLRVQSAERIRAAVLKALEQIHGLLSSEQRLRLAYLIRTGTLTM